MIIAKIFVQLNPAKYRVKYFQPPTTLCTMCQSMVYRIMCSDNVVKMTCAQNKK